MAGTDEQTDERTEERAEERTEGAGPFTTRITRPLDEGGTAVWESRLARKRGAVMVSSAENPQGVPRHADLAARSRLRRLNAIASWAFAIGGALFVLGAAVAEFGSGDASTCAVIYFVGGLFFNTGGYASLLQVINSPRPENGPHELVTPRWRWWSYEPRRIDWLSTFLLFTGTLVFGVNLVDSFFHGLSAQRTNELVWGPDMIGCVLFLVSGHLALVEVCHGRLGIRVQDLGWWVVAANQLGSVLFLVSAFAAYTRPANGVMVDVTAANWGTLAGALCFVLGGVLQGFERPVTSPASVADVVGAGLFSP
ncbi:hypothetical protein NGB36_17555 [Streptomyces sp. RB6PN25]|uniref:NADH-ubiquinone oxidoreductase n=1 Tax=Streptomyces humicola TaxID=2953240 RepID=A0ABT1PXG4_9ACTN|nr:hypothetical protein [Streptomyces humicola]MCQ4082356.1 hypothetical protein [Streptomyces humicola]